MANGYEIGRYYLYISTYACGHEIRTWATGRNTGGTASLGAGRAKPDGFLCKVAAFQAAREVTVLSDYEVGKMNIQLIANEENQDRAQRGKNEAGGMISFVCRARKHVGNGAS